MSTQDFRKLSTVLRSIELIEEKTNILHSQYTTSIKENDNHQPTLIDDSNVHLQLFFQHLEQLLQVDLKNRTFLSNNNNKRNYWNFVSLALKESKGLYDTVLYVLNSQEVKTSTGRGRLFLRFCLQSHRLGDVIQQSFMMTKIVHQFYIDECFWTIPTYMNRVIQALYQLNDLQFDLLSNSQYQLDVCWPTIEITEQHPTALSDEASRIRNSSTSSILSMNSVDPQSIISILPEGSDPIQITPTIFANLDSSINDGSSTRSISSTEEDPENTIFYWKEKCLQLEMQLQEVPSMNDVEIQCSLNEDEFIDKQLFNKLNDENEELKNEINFLNNKKEELESDMNILNNNNEELKNETNILNEQNERLNTEINILKEEMNNLNFQLSSISMHRSTAADKIKEYERDIAHYQSLIANKEILLNELQAKLNEQTKSLRSIQEESLSLLNEQNKRVEFLQIELDKSTKLLENERILMEKERGELNKGQEKLEALLQEKILDFEEMKRRLVKAVREKAELFNTIHSYELKLEQQQTKKWVPDEEVLNCTKCKTAFGWTVRKHHCRHCQRIFCNNCSNNWIQSSKTNSPQYRICDYCNEEDSKESPIPNDKIHSVVFNNHGTADEVDLHFEVRSERLNPTTDTQSTT